MNRAMIRPAGLGLVVSLLGCQGAERATESAPAALSATTEQVRLALEPVCASCHLQGSKGFFQSAATFEDLLVYQPRYVVPGQPDQGELIALLEGRGGGVFRQMPTAGANYAAMAAQNPNLLPVAQIREWIANLPPRGGMRDRRSNPSAITVRRISSEQIKATLYRDLGLSDDDFFYPGMNFGIPTYETRGEDNYPLHGQDEFPGAHSGEASKSGVRHFALGGRSALASRKRDPAITPAFVQALVPLTQRWCRLSAAKGARSPLFTAVQPTDRVAADPAKTKRQVAAWHQLFLGEAAAPEEVDRLVQELLSPLEAESDATTAWVGLCSYFLRHPRFLFY